MEVAHAGQSPIPLANRRSRNHRSRWLLDSRILMLPKIIQTMKLRDAYRPVANRNASRSGSEAARILSCVCLTL